jgi:hypothetical protein
MQNLKIQKNKNPKIPQKHVLIKNTPKTHLKKTQTQKRPQKSASQKKMQRTPPTRTSRQREHTNP